MVHGSARVHGFILLEKVSCNSKVKEKKTSSIA